MLELNSILEPSLPFRMVLCDLKQREGGERLGTGEDKETNTGGEAPLCGG